MPAYKFYYFDLRGRGEAIRLCFAAGGIPYEDVRMTREEFIENKASKYFISDHANMSGLSNAH